MGSVKAVEIQPVQAASLFGLTAGTIQIEGDIVEPAIASQEWNVNP